LKIISDTFYFVQVASSVKEYIVNVADLFLDYHCKIVLKSVKVSKYTL
jgi:hypothetical protein